MVIYHTVKPTNDGVEGTKYSKESQGTEPKSAVVRFLATLGSVFLGGSTVFLHEKAQIAI